MKERLVEGIRQLLIRTVLPVRKKKEEFLGKLRLSLTFRTAINYSKLFVIFGIIILLIFGLIFMALFDYEYDSKVDKVQENVRDIAAESDENIVWEGVNPYLAEGLELKITDADSGRILYNEVEGNEESPNILGKIYLSGIGKDRQLILYRNATLTIGDESSLTLEFRIDFSKEYNLYMKSMKFMLILIILLAIVMSVSGAKQMRFIMTPIEQMSKAANKLTVNNLNSERLNVAGTKNELKDLAATINEMLDRIELSYESQKQFVSDASHELRTPIAVIQGYVNMVDRWGKEDTTIMEEAIEAIKEESQNMKELVEKLLFLSRHDKKTLKLEKLFFNMKEVVDEILKETAMVAKDRIVRTEALEDVNVYGDKQSLKQAIRVFVDNAIKYSNEGDEVIISCMNRNGNCVVSVEDTGIGMKEKDINNIFERFYRADEVRGGNVTGHGLGLSIAKLIILRHTGTIKVRSQYGKGTCFTVILPRIYR